LKINNLSKQFKDLKIKNKSFFSKTQGFFSKTQIFFLKTQEFFSKTQGFYSKTQFSGESIHAPKRISVQKKPVLDAIKIWKAFVMNKRI